MNSVEGDTTGVNTKRPSILFARKEQQQQQQGSLELASADHAEVNLDEAEAGGPKIKNEGGGSILEPFVKCSDARFAYDVLYDRVHSRLVTVLAIVSVALATFTGYEVLLITSPESFKTVSEVSGHGGGGDGFNRNPHTKLY